MGGMGGEKRPRSKTNEKKREERRDWVRERKRKGGYGGGVVKGRGGSRGKRKNEVMKARGVKMEMSHAKSFSKHLNRVILWLV